MLSGALPTALADPTAMQAIQQLSLAGNRINSTLPVEWAVAGAFPSILELDLSRNELSGSLPEEWGGPTAFAGMSALCVTCSPPPVLAHVGEVVSAPTDRHHLHTEQDCFHMSDGVRRRGRSRLPQGLLSASFAFMACGALWQMSQL